MSESLDKNTIFGEEYNHWKENGYSHVEAMNKARDYYRRFTRREALDGDGVILALVESADPTIDDLVDFQRLFEKVVLNLVDEDIRLYCGLLQMCNADIFLTDHQQRFVGIVMRGASINTIGDLARWDGLHSTRSRYESDAPNSSIETPRSTTEVGIQRQDLENHPFGFLPSLTDSTHA